MKKIFITILSLVSFSIFAAEWTPSPGLVIDEIQYDGAGKNIYLKTETAGWGAPSCPDAQFIWIKPSVTYQNELLKVVLSAKMSGTKMRFKGDCSSTLGYFETTYIMMLD